MQCPDSLPNRSRAGFTLIEISVVLVIIALIIGGIVVARDLASAAAVRSQITQIEKYNAAVNTFLGKYGALPGDIKDPAASSFGFVARGPYPGQGDGNGIIEGNVNNALGWNTGYLTALGEMGVFWRDLTASNLIEGNFNTATSTAYSITATSTISNYLPAAKIGRGNYIYVYSGGYTIHDGSNYFGLSAVTQLSGWGTSSAPALTVREAYSIDTKIDDGFPQLGRVRADYINNLSNGYFEPIWAAGNGQIGTGSGHTSASPSTSTTQGTSTTCFDNGSTAGATQQYSMEISNGTNINCALSIRMQAGN